MAKDLKSILSTLIFYRPSLLPILSITLGYLSLAEYKI